MPASVNWELSHTTDGTPAFGAPSPESAIVFNKDNSNGPAEDYPLVKPSSGFDRSMTKAAHVHVTGTYASLTDLKVYLSKAALTGTAIYYDFKATYIATNVIPSDDTGYTAMGTTPISWREADATPISALSGGDADPDSSPWGDYLYMYLRIDSTVLGGIAVSPPNIIAQYDEV